MVFSSLEFLFWFMPVTLILYYAVPAKHLKWRNVVLFLTSLVFYGWSEPRFLILMVLTISVDYIGGLFIGKTRENKKLCKHIRNITVAVNILILAFFKYYNFIYRILSSFLPIPKSLELNVTLPIGISFYTFQSLSYVIDVYRMNASVQRDPIAFGTYVTLFPQLVAGPIVRYHDVDQMLLYRRENVKRFSDGIRRFIVGLSKKVLLSNMAAALWESIKAVPAENRTVLIAWLCVITYTFHIYFDFSGYSDMAIGLGKMFGFEFLENFNYPYIAKSIKDFWDRWHISLSSWFKEYLYIPLGGNRCSKFKQLRNLFIVWLLTGMWHGANFNYILWGLYYFALLVIEKNLLRNVLPKMPVFLRRIVTMLLVGIGWLIFAFEDLSAGFLWFRNMFGFGVTSFATGSNVFDLLRNIPFLIILVIGATPVPKKIYDRLTEKSNAAKAVFSLLGIALMFVSVAYLVSSSFNPFIYTTF